MADNREDDLGTPPLPPVEPPPDTSPTDTTTRTQAHDADKRPRDEWRPSVVLPRGE